MKCEEPGAGRSAEVRIKVGDTFVDEYEDGFLPSIESDESSSVAKVCYVPVETGQNIAISVVFDGLTSKGAVDLVVDGVLRNSKVFTKKRGNASSSIDFDTAYINNKGNFDNATMLVEDLNAKINGNMVPCFPGYIEVRISITRGTDTASYQPQSLKRFNDKILLTWDDTVDGGFLPADKQISFKGKQDFLTDYQVKQTALKRPGARPWATFRFYYRSLKSIKAIDRLVPNAGTLWTLDLPSIAESDQSKSHETASITSEARQSSRAPSQDIKPPAGPAITKSVTFASEPPQIVTTAKAAAIRKPTKKEMAAKQKTDSTNLPTETADSIEVARRNHAGEKSIEKETQQTLRAESQDESLPSPQPSPKAAPKAPAKRSRPRTRGATPLADVDESIDEVAEDLRVEQLPRHTMRAGPRAKRTYDPQIHGDPQINGTPSTVDGETEILLREYRNNSLNVAEQETIGPAVKESHKPAAQLDGAAETSKELPNQSNRRHTEPVFQLPEHTKANGTKRPRHDEDSRALEQLIAEKRRKLNEQKMRRQEKEKLAEETEKQRQEKLRKILEELDAEESEEMRLEQEADERRKRSEEAMLGYDGLREA